MSHEILFTPVTLGALRLPNRLVMAPMTRNRAGPDQVPTEMAATYYRQRASAGLVITEATPVEPRGHGYPGIPGIYTDAQEEGWRHIVEEVHEADGRIFSQLWHTGRIGHPRTAPDGSHPVAPSAVRPEGEAMTPEGMKPFPEPRGLEREEIPELVDRFAASAERARRAGFDGVELHAANGYLVDQFLRDGTNRRTDEYGGGVEARCRFLLEIVEALVDVHGAERVGVRLSPLNDFNDMRDSDPTATFGTAAARLDRFGLAYLHLVEPEDGPKPPVGEAADGEVGPVFEEIREVFSGPLMVNGGYGRESAARAVEAGYADAVSFGKKFLANPDLRRRFAEDLPLNEPDPETFYGGGAEGYVDYPAWEDSEAVST